MSYRDAFDLPPNYDRQTFTCRGCGKQSHGGSDNRRFCTVACFKAWKARGKA